MALHGASTMVWVSGAEGPLRSLADVIAAARAAPGWLSYALPGSGTVNHLIVEAFKLRHGLDMPAVPYRGTAAAQTDVIAGITSTGDTWCKATNVDLRMDTEISRQFLASFVALP